jgi:hypothetical protein
MRLHKTPSPVASVTTNPLREAFDLKSKLLRDCFHSFARRDLFDCAYYQLFAREGCFKFPRY